MLALLLLVLSPAHATDVATSKKLGLGVATGYPYLNITAKYYLDDKGGIALYLGTAGTFQNLRGAYQRELAELGNWSWARLPLYWQAGADLGLWTTGYGYAAPRIGVFGGAGASLQFHKVPAEVFVEAGIGVLPLNGYCHDANLVADGACWIGVSSEAGGRWYF